MKHRRRQAKRERAEPNRDKHVTVKDVWGRKHRVPRVALADPPPPNATVIDLAGKDPAQIVRALALATHKEADLATTGEFTIRDGDMNKLARMAGLFRITERPKQLKELRHQRERLAKRARKMRQSAGKKKAGRLMPQTALIYATVRVLSARGGVHDSDTALAVLSGEHLDADPLLETIADAVNPIELPNDGPPVDVEAGTVFFRFKNRPDRKMTLARFRNAVSEAARSSV